MAMTLSRHDTLCRELPWEPGRLMCVFECRFSKGEGTFKFGQIGLLAYTGSTLVRRPDSVSRLIKLSSKVGFVALRQNKPASSGRIVFCRSRQPERRSAWSYLSQRDKFHLVSRPALKSPASGQHIRQHLAVDIRQA